MTIMNELVEAPSGAGEGDGCLIAVAATAIVALLIVGAFWLVA